MSDYQALAEQAVEAAEAHRAASREHDLAMDAHAEHAELYGSGPEAEAGLTTPGRRDPPQARRPAADQRTDPSEEDQSWQT
jgi:hypothetical protein